MRKFKHSVLLVDTGSYAVQPQPPAEVPGIYPSQGALVKRLEPDKVHLIPMWLFKMVNNPRQPGIWTSDLPVERSFRGPAGGKCVCVRVCVLPTLKQAQRGSPVLLPPPPSILYRLSFLLPIGCYPTLKLNPSFLSFFSFFLYFTLRSLFYPNRSQFPLPILPFFLSFPLSSFPSFPISYLPSLQTYVTHFSLLPSSRHPAYFRTV